MIASVRPGDEDFVTGLGAAETVDYTGDLAATIRDRYADGIDAVIDAVNRDAGAFTSLVGLVRSGGRATSVVGGAGESTAIDGVSVSNTGGHPPHLSPRSPIWSCRATCASRSVARTPWLKRRRPCRTS